jgi:hypothetical protein
MPLRKGSTPYTSSAMLGSRPKNPVFQSIMTSTRYTSTHPTNKIASPELAPKILRIYSPM